MRRNLKSTKARPSKSPLNRHWNEPARILRGAAAVLISAGLMFFWFSKVGTGPLLSSLSQMRMGPLWFALALNITFPFFASIRWKAALELCGLKRPFSKVLGLFMAAWPLASVTPAKLGDLLRVWAFQREKKGWPALASLVVERFFDLTVLFLLAALGGYFIFPQADHWILAGLLTALLLGWVFFFLAGSSVVSWIEDRFSISFNRKNLSGIFLRILGGSLGVWLLSVAQWQAVLEASGIQVSFLDSLLKVPPALLAGMIPLAWMGLGTRDGTFLAVYSGQIPAEKILAASLIFTAIRYLAPGLLGWPWTFAFFRASGRASSGKNKKRSS